MDTNVQECIRCGHETDCIGEICLECGLPNGTPKYAVPLDAWNNLVTQKLSLEKQCDEAMSRLKQHQKGEAGKYFCISCTKPMWLVDEAMVCPFCGTMGNHVPDIDAEILT